MKLIIRYAAAFILTILMLAIARKTSTRHAVEFNTAIEGVSFSHNTTTESFGESPVLTVKASDTNNITAMVYFSNKAGGPYESLVMNPGPDGFSCELPVLPKGQKWFYHINISRNGVPLAVFPAKDDQFIKFKGHVSPLVIYPHIFFMFATIFTGLITVFLAFEALKNKEYIIKSVKYLMWTVIFVFIGGIPLGYLVAYQTFGQGWGGIPIGWDITDNKTLIILFFWLITFLLSLKGLKGGDLKISRSLYFALVILSFVVTFISYMIPHSI